MDGDEIAQMNLRAKADKLKWIHDRLAKQKKNFEKMKETRILTPIENTEFVETLTKLNSFNEQCKNFIRFRKNGSSMFSIEDYLMWAHKNSMSSMRFAPNAPGMVNSGGAMSGMVNSSGAMGNQGHMGMPPNNGGHINPMLNASGGMGNQGHMGNQGMMSSQGHMSSQGMMSPIQTSPGMINSAWRNHPEAAGYHNMQNQQFNYDAMPMGNEKKMGQANAYYYTSQMRQKPYSARGMNPAGPSNYCNGAMSQRFPPLTPILDSEDKSNCEPFYMHDGGHFGGYRPAQDMRMQDTRAQDARAMNREYNQFMGQEMMSPGFSSLSNSNSNFGNSTLSNPSSILGVPMYGEYGDVSPRQRYTAKKDRRNPYARIMENPRPEDAYKTHQEGLHNLSQEAFAGDSNKVHMPIKKQKTPELQTKRVHESNAFLNDFVRRPEDPERLFYPSLETGAEMDNLNRSYGEKHSRDMMANKKKREFYFNLPRKALSDILKAGQLAQEARATPPMEKMDESFQTHLLAHLDAFLHEVHNFVFAATGPLPPTLEDFKTVVSRLLKKRKSDVGKRKEENLFI